MVLRAVPFEYIAESIGRRAADLFASSTMVVDEHDVVVARAEPGGRATSGTMPRDWCPVLRIPIRLPDRTGHLIVANHEEWISPRLSHELIGFDDAIQIRLALLLRTVGSDAASRSLPQHADGAPSR